MEHNETISLRTGSTADVAQHQALKVDCTSWADIRMTSVDTQGTQAGRERPRRRLLQNTLDGEPVEDGTSQQPSADTAQASDAGDGSNTSADDAADGSEDALPAPESAPTKEELAAAKAADGALRRVERRKERDYFRDLRDRRVDKRDLIGNPGCFWLIYYPQRTHPHGACACCALSCCDSGECLRSYGRTAL